MGESPSAKRSTLPTNQRLSLYSGVGTSGSDILVMNSDGTDQRRLTDTPGYDYYPDWSPDGREIIFQKDYHDFYKIRADGTGLTNLTHTAALAWYSLNSPSWSPDGKKIAFWGQRIVRFDNDIGEFILAPGIYLMNPDGSGVTKIPGTDGFSVSDLELPSIGWLLFLPDSSPNDWIASCPTVVTFATRLLTEPLRLAT
jgi:Tol biopolymer transport system component